MAAFTLWRRAQLRKLAGFMPSEYAAMAVVTRSRPSRPVGVVVTYAVCPHLPECHAGRMHRVFRRLLGVGPSPSEVTLAAGREFLGLVVQGLQDPRPLTAEEWAHLDAYTSAVARRSFSMLYDDED